jgi:hypothetical protein
MSIYRKAFLIWLGVIVPTVMFLTIVGLTCDNCIDYSCCEFIQ